MKKIFKAFVDVSSLQTLPRYFLEKMVKREANDCCVVKFAFGDEQSVYVECDSVREAQALIQCYAKRELSRRKTMNKKPKEPDTMKVQVA